MANKKYTKAKRLAAAIKGWTTRHKKLEDHGLMSTVTSAGDGSSKDLATELPTSRLFEAGGMASWDDDVSLLDADGYQLMRRSAPLIKSIGKRGTRIAKLNWSVHGSGARAEAMAEILDLSLNWTDMVKWLTWAAVEGVRFMQIKQAPSGVSTRWIVPDFFMGGRRKFKAGGDMQWDGTRLVQTIRNTGVVSVEAKTLPMWQFIIHRPGGGSSPEGDLDCGVAAYRLAYSWASAHKNLDGHMELFGVPIRVFKGNLNKTRPDQVSAVVAQRAAKLAALANNSTAILNDGEMLELIEPKGKGFEDMVEYVKYIEGVFDQLFLDNQLTSSVSDAGRTGDTSIHLNEESESIFSGAMELASSLNRHLLPWIARKNPDLPELGEDENEPFIWPEPAEEEDETDDQSITTVGEEPEPEIESVTPTVGDTQPSPSPKPDLSLVPNPEPATVANAEEK